MRPETIGREVVSMLNAGGGRVWIGLREEKGRAVGVEPIADAETERQRLRDYLMDTIEPLPLADEIEVGLSGAESEGQILSVRAGSWAMRRPYAHLQRGGRFFFIRMGDRTRPMRWDELFRDSGVLREGAETGIEAAMYQVVEERQALQKAGEQVLWLSLRPARHLHLDLDPERLLGLREPRATGNRAVGWNFREVEARNGGALVFRAPLGALYFKGDEREIWPAALLEYPVSAFRIARRIYEGVLEEADLIAADLALIGARGWKLRPGSQRAAGYRPPAAELGDLADAVLERPLVLTYGELAAHPDRGGYRLIERVYEVFGFRRDAIPREYDPASGRLVLPE